MRRPSWRVVVTAVLVTACGPIAPSFGVPATPFELLPGPAYLHLDGEPSTAGGPFVVTFAGPDGDRSGRSFAFETGQRVVIDRTSFAEIVSVWVDEIPCDGTARTLTDRETDGILTIADGACAVTTTRNHAGEDDIHEALPGTLSAEAPLGSRLSLTTLDQAIPGELTDDADESGWISFEEVPAGRWRAVLSSGGQRLGESTITIEAGEHQHIDLRDD